MNDGNGSVKPRARAVLAMAVLVLAATAANRAEAALTPESCLAKKLKEGSWT